jgi:hypothetical protein
MPTSSAELWYCDHIVAGPWPFALLLLPLAGAYYYGRQRIKLGWILIGLWIALQIPMSFVNNIMVNCAEDAPMPPPLSESVPDEPASPPPTMK